MQNYSLQSIIENCNENYDRKCYQSIHLKLLPLLQHCPPIGLFFDEPFDGCRRRKILKIDCWG